MDPLVSWVGVHALLFGLVIARRVFMTVTGV